MSPQPMIFFGSQRASWGKASKSPIKRRETIIELMKCARQWLNVLHRMNATIGLKSANRIEPSIY
jgi:hypothetical protein